MLKNKLNISRSAVCTLASISLLSFNVGAWPWSSKKETKPAPVPQKPMQTEVYKEPESLEVREARNSYNNAEAETQKMYSKYQEATAKYKKANVASREAYENLQKITAEWMEAKAKTDAAHEKYYEACDSNADFYNAWVKSSATEQELRVKKDNAYIAWVKVNTEEKEAYKLREESYKKYIAASMNQKNAHAVLVKACIDISTEME